jgi:CDGSH-type Zn-finger protein
MARGLALAPCALNHVFCLFKSWLPQKRRGGKMPATKITVNNNGSLRVEGDFEIVDPTGKPFGLAGRTAIGLCRCGRSANKPFCDGSHNSSGFSDMVAARELPPPKPKI